MRTVEKPPMDLRKDGRFLYMSSIDLSGPNGPGVNEREFVAEFCRTFDDRFHVLVPKPVNEMEKITGGRWFYGARMPQWPMRSLSGLLEQLNQSRIADRIIRSHDINFLIVRIDSWPIAIDRVRRSHPLPFAIKTLGSGRLSGMEPAPAGFREDALSPGSGGGWGRNVKVFLSRLSGLYPDLSDQLVRQVVSRASAIDVCTEALAGQVVKKCGVDAGKVKVVGNATNTDRFKPADTMGCRRQLALSHLDPILGYVGGSPMVRGGRHIIELVSRLKGKYENIGGVVVGGKEEVRVMKDLAGKKGVAERCVFPGTVPYEKVPAYVNSFDVGFAMDSEDTVDIKGNSNQKVRQYLACGRPVVASPGGNDFLVERKIGSIVGESDMDHMEREAESWLRMSDDQKGEFLRRAVSYAVGNLGTAKAMEDRLSFWNERV